MISDFLIRDLLPPGEDEVSCTYIVRWLLSLPRSERDTVRYRISPQTDPEQHIGTQVRTPG